jgi:hypothetical protein
MTNQPPGCERYWFCPGCGTEAIAGASFCGECGTSLAKPTAIHGTSAAYGDLVPASASATETENPTRLDGIAPPGPIPKRQQVDPRADLYEWSKRACPNGHSVPSGERTCPNCGEPPSPQPLPTDRPEQLVYDIQRLNSNERSQFKAFLSDHRIGHEWDGNRVTIGTADGPSTDSFFSEQLNVPVDYTQAAWHPESPNQADEPSSTEREPVAELQDDKSLLIHLPFDAAMDRLITVLRSIGSATITSRQHFSASVSGQELPPSNSMYDVRVSFSATKQATLAVFSFSTSGVSTALGQMVEQIARLMNVKPSTVQPPPPVTAKQSTFSPQPLDSPQSGTVERWNGLSIASFVLGLVPVIPFAGSVVAVVLGAIGLRQSSERRERGRGLAGWGIGLGILSVVFWVVLIAVLVAGPSNTSSPSYKDGYAFGIQEANLDYASPGTVTASNGGIEGAANTDCTSQAYPAPLGDDQGEFTAGCIAGYTMQYNLDGGLQP